MSLFLHVKKKSHKNIKHKGLITVINFNGFNENILIVIEQTGNMKTLYLYLRTSYTYNTCTWQSCAILIYITSTS